MLTASPLAAPQVSAGSSEAPAVASLDDVARRIREFDASSADGDAVLAMIGAVEDAVRCLRGYATVLGARMEELHAEGSGISARDAFAIAGRLSDHHAHLASRRTALAGHLPAVGEAIHRGTAPTENLDALAAARHKLRHHDHWLSRFDAMDRTLAHRAGRHRPKRFTEWLNRIVHAITIDDSEVVTERERNSLRTWTTGEGRLRASMDLDAEAGSRFLHALDAQSASLASRRRQAGEQFRLDDHHRACAFSELVEGTNAGYGRAAVNVVVDHATLTEGPHAGTIARTTNGFDLPIDTIRRFLCDAWMTHTLLSEGGIPLAVGRSHRTATDAQRNALAAVHDSCALCDVPFAHCQIHHLIEWEAGGLTDIENLVPLCSSHHHEVHAGRTILELAADRTLHVARGDGTVWQTIPPPSRGPARLRHRHRQRQRARRPGPRPDDPVPPGPDPASPPHHSSPPIC